MKPAAVPVKYIVFDLGKVLIDYSYRDFFALMRERGVRSDKVEDFLVEARLHQYEHGHISCDAFVAGMNRLLADPLPEAELRAAWNGLFTPIVEMLELAAQLKHHYPVFVLSNIGKLHWDFLRSTYDLGACCRGLLASFEVGAMKPAAAIYQAAQQRFVLEPEYTLFIDDKPENIRGAMVCGWQGLVHSTPAATRDCLYKLTGFAN